MEYRDEANLTSTRYLASDALKDAARPWIDKLSVKNGTYPPDSYPNPGESQNSARPRLILTIWRLPALAYHNAQLEASAFREEFDPEAFEDLTLPKHDIIHKARHCSAPSALTD